MNRPAFPENPHSRLNRAQFEALIPHSGRMCLIDSVEFWDDRSIYCLSGTHRQQSNPLRTRGELSSIHLLEYGVQAMAIHGALLNSSATRGMLAALRNVRLYIESAETLSAPIRITASAVANSAHTAIYHFEVADSDGSLLVEARATAINR
ncbi:MAG: hypothetical protein ACRERU_16620 [Methylococcales bacterium]